MFNKAMAYNFVLFGKKHLRNLSLCLDHPKRGSMLGSTSSTSPLAQCIATSQMSPFNSAGTLQLLQPWLELMKVFSITDGNGVKQFVKLSLTGVFR